MLFLIIPILLLLLLYYTFEDIYLMYAKCVPPGPLSLPLIGGLHHLNLTKPHLSLWKLADKYGGILSIRMGPLGRVIFINDASLAEKMGRNAATANRPSVPYFDIISKNADGIGSCDYNLRWKLQTKIIKGTLKKLSQTNLSENAHQIFPKLFERLDERKGQPFDPRNDLRLACINLMSMIVYGYHYDNWEDPEIKTMDAYHDIFLSALNPVHPLNLFPWIKHLPFHFVKKHYRSVEQRDEIMNKRFEEHKQRYTGNISDILDMVTTVMDTNNNELNLSTKQRKHLDLNSLMMSLWTINMAGTDDIHLVFCWLLIYLAKTPEVMEKIKAEVKENIPQSSYPTTDHKKMMPYTEATTLELLRIVPVNIFGIPHFTHEDIKMGKHNIPKGSTIFTNMWYIHHQEKHWPNPQEFNPSRFIKEDGSVITADDRKSMPFMTFGKGKRTCIGQEVGLDLIFLFVCYVVRKYEISFPPSFVPDMTGKVVFGLRPCDLKIILRERNDEI